MESSFRDSGGKIYLMDPVRKCGLMEANSRGSLGEERRMGKGGMCGETVRKSQPIGLMGW